MSRAQKLVNRAIEVLKRLRAGELNEQKALVEIRALLDRTDDSGTGTASDQVKLAAATMQQHKENLLNNQQAIGELSRIFTV